MRKLKLDIDALRVDSFAVTSSAGGQRGTVRGFHTTTTEPITQPVPYTEDLRCDTGGGGGSLGCPITTFEVPCETFTCI
jgi:hypothetical protein